MPSTNVVQQANGLYRGLREIRAAIRLLDEGGRITAIDLSPTPEEGATAGFTIRVTTSYMQYPPQMVDAIKAQMTTQAEEITQKIEELGFTVEPENTGEGLPEPDPGPLPEPPGGGEEPEPQAAPAAAVTTPAPRAAPPQQRQPTGARPQIRPPGFRPPGR